MHGLRLKEPCRQKLLLRHQNRRLWILCLGSKSLMKKFFLASCCVPASYVISFFVVCSEMMLFRTVKMFRNFGEKRDDKFFTSICVIQPNCLHIFMR